MAPEQSQAYKNQKEVQVFFDRIETEDLVRDMQFFNVVEDVHRENFLTKSDGGIK